ncbi:MAG TPA: hypothetical protein VFN44_18720 [Solirubrobacteraceae bacterium]|nr:hypothetical protein [Solirubrobacteraceae bacterium]
MTHRRTHRAAATAVALAVLAALPAAASAHPVDCAGSKDLTRAPSGERWVDWGGGSDGCVTVASEQAAGPDRTPANASAAGDRPTGSFRQVGHEALRNRGMNAAIAVHGDYAYVGSRTDGGHTGQPQGGLMVVDIAQPSQPKLVAGPLDPRPGESTRELRVWRSKGVLIVLNTNCGVGPTLHECTVPSISNIRFYDIRGNKAANPRLIQELKVDTHEFFLWEDPNDSDRALIFAGNASSTCGTRGGAPSCPFSVWDISQVRDRVAPKTLYSGPYPYSRFPAAPEPVQKPTGGLHSLTISNDGSEAFFALLTGGFAIADVSDFAQNKPFPQPRPITRNESRPTWAGPGAHSAVRLWNRDWAWVSDEVYGSATGPDHGCPWGWARMVDVSDPQAPTVKAEYREPENDPDSCSTWNPPRTSYSAHNPTLTPHIAFSTWHSSGMEAVSVEDPTQPYQLAQFEPKPLDSVLIEDPRLSSDPDTGRNEKVVMWSYAIVKDGLIYVVDLRNGLYVLKYEGPYQDEVDRIRYLDGNSNQGDALCFDPVGQAPRGCR